jgi:hypothetical protein
MSEYHDVFDRDFDAETDTDPWVHQQRRHLWVCWGTSVQGLDIRGLLLGRGILRKDAVLLLQLIRMVSEASCHAPARSKPTYLDPPRSQLKFGTCNTTAAAIMTSAAMMA